MNEDRLRALFTRHTAVHAMLRDGTVVPLEAMLEVLEHRGSEEHRRDILNQILADPESRKEFDLLRAAMRASAPEAVPPEAAPGAERDASPLPE